MGRGLHFYAIFLSLSLYPALWGASNNHGCQAASVLSAAATSLRLWQRF